VFKELAHKNGILPKQANSFLGAYLSMESAAKKAQDESRGLEEKQAVEGLQKEWGKAFDFKVSLAKRAIADLKIEGMQDWIEKRGLDNDPMMVKVLAAYSEATAEDTIVGDGGGRLTKTPADIQAEINEIRGNKSHPKNAAYKDPRHSSHKDVSRYMEDLYKQLHGAS
jgi:hypothetical protein